MLRRSTVSISAMAVAGSTPSRWATSSVMPWMAEAPSGIGMPGLSSQLYEPFTVPSRMTRPMKHVTMRSSSVFTPVVSRSNTHSEGMSAMAIFAVDVCTLRPYRRPPTLPVRRPAQSREL